VIRARIGTLRLRIPTGDRRFAKALATAVASRLALHVGERGPDANGLARTVQANAPRSTQATTWAASIVDGIVAGGEMPRKGRR
jgi:hypothetical protein